MYQLKIKKAALRQINALPGRSSAQRTSVERMLELCRWVYNETLAVRKNTYEQASNLTLERDSVGNWYACFSCECEDQPREPTPNVVGIDLGLTTFAYFSNGERASTLDEKDAADIARLQRKQGKFAKGRAERHKIIHALGHAYERCANRRNTCAHQESCNLVNEYQFILPLDPCHHHALDKIALQRKEDHNRRQHADQ